MSSRILSEKNHIADLKDKYKRLGAEQVKVLYDVYSNPSCQRESD